MLLNLFFSFRIILNSFRLVPIVSFDKKIKILTETIFFCSFIDEENMHKDVINYQNVMPEEYRMTYPERTRRLLPPRQY
jgi:hypothetical protein